MSDLYAKLAEPFPAEAMTVDNSRGFKLTSIKAQYVRERLNKVMGVDGWETNAEIVDRNANGDVAVRVSMTLHFAKRSVTRSAFGGASKKAKGQTFGDIYKSAETDALCKVASNFGVGNDVFKGLVDANNLGKMAAKPTSKAKKATTPKKSNDDFRPSATTDSGW